VSLHPEFAARILRGEKRVEFRRRALGRDTTDLIIYATAPVRAVVGVAEIERVKQGSPTSLWNAFRGVAGIERGPFFDYFEGVTEGFAYVLGPVRACASPLRLGMAGLPMNPPQAFQYITTRTLDAVLRKALPRIETAQTLG